ncbi:MAG: hypothetical protein ACI94Y_003817, partial [Maribacter sp.]
MIYKMLLIIMCVIWAGSAYSQKRGVQNL